MKKIIALFLMIAVLGLVGCRNEPDPTRPTDQEIQHPTSAVTPPSQTETRQPETTQEPEPQGTVIITQPTQETVGSQEDEFPADTEKDTTVGSSGATEPPAPSETIAPTDPTEPSDPSEALTQSTVPTDLTQGATEPEQGSTEGSSETTAPTDGVIYLPPIPG